MVRRGDAKASTFKRSIRLEGAMKTVDVDRLKQRIAKLRQHQHTFATPAAMLDGLVWEVSDLAAEPYPVNQRDVREHAAAAPWEQWYLELREAIGGPAFPAKHAWAIRHARAMRAADDTLTAEVLARWEAERIAADALRYGAEECERLRARARLWERNYFDVADAIARDSDGVEDLVQKVHALRAANTPSPSPRVEVPVVEVVQGAMGFRLMFDGEQLLYDGVPGYLTEAKKVLIAWFEKNWPPQSAGGATFPLTAALNDIMNVVDRCNPRGRTSSVMQMDTALVEIRELAHQAIAVPADSTLSAPGAGGSHPLVEQMANIADALAAKDAEIGRLTQERDDWMRQAMAAAREQNDAVAEEQEAIARMAIRWADVAGDDADGQGVLRRLAETVRARTAGGGGDTDPLVVTTPGAAACRHTTFIAGDGDGRVRCKGCDLMFTLAEVMALSKTFDASTPPPVDAGVVRALVSDIISAAVNETRAMYDGDVELAASNREPIERGAVESVLELLTAARAESYARSAELMRGFAREADEVHDAHAACWAEEAARRIEALAAAAGKS